MRLNKSGVKTRLAVFGALALLLIICSFFSAYLTPYDPYLQNLDIAKQPPTRAHPLGTDRYGRDMLSRVIAGSRASIFSTLLLVAVITGLGTAVGVTCGWVGGLTDTVLMRISDVFLAFPGLVFALAVAGANTSPGKARNISDTRMSTASAHPPKKPPQRPTAVPSTVTAATSSSVEKMLVRLPTMTRDSISRP